MAVSVSDDACKGKEEGGRTCRGYLSWVLVAAFVGFAISAVFAGVFEIDRVWYLAIYAPSVLVVIVAYLRWSEVDVAGLFRRNYRWGLLVGVLIGVFSVNSVLLQSSSDMPEGADLVFNLTWLGVIYGALDALLLSVLPVHATFQALRSRYLPSSRKEKVLAGVMATLVSMFVIGIYHVGYPEFQNAEVFVIMIGVGLQSVGYVITKSPLAPIVSHVAMHITAVLYGINSVIQLPPHY